MAWNSLVLERNLRVYRKSKSMKMNFARVVSLAFVLATLSTLAGTVSQNLFQSTSHRTTVQIFHHE